MSLSNAPDSQQQYFPACTVFTIFNKCSTCIHENSFQAVFPNDCVVITLIHFSLPEISINGMRCSLWLKTSNETSFLKSTTSTAVVHSMFLWQHQQTYSSFKDSFKHSNSHYISVHPFMLSSHKGTLC